MATCVGLKQSSGRVVNPEVIVKFWPSILARLRGGRIQNW